jgi:hypothetical protein
MGPSRTTRMPLAMTARSPLPAAPWRVTRLGTASRDRLARAPAAAGRVHSAFVRAINILWHDGRLLTLQGAAPLAAPFALALRDFPPTATIEPGMLIRRSHFDWSDAETVALEVPRGPLAFRANLLPAPPSARALCSGAGRRARQALADSLAERDAGAFVAAAEALIGLGEGLTPAGDDLLAGALAAIHRLAPDWLNPEVIRRLGEAARSRTTDVARDFLLEALAGRFAEPVLAVLAAPSVVGAEAAARQLLAFGATSGADTLDGLRLGCRALQPREPSIPWISER